MGQFCCAPEDDYEDEPISDISKDSKIDSELLNEGEIGQREQIERIQVQKSGMRDNKRISLHHFELINVIGKGSFGKVLLVRKKTSNKYYAMKILQKNNIDSKNKIKHTQNERQILANANYHFAVSMRYAFQSKSKLYFIMDFINGGELFRRLRKHGPFNEPTAKFYIAEIICAIEYFHKKNIIYRDLKPENILIDCEGHLKLTDFGLAKQLESENDFAHTICGTPEYLAPEIIMRKSYGRQVDYWTIGILLYELLTLRTPFRAKDKREIFENVLTKEVPMKTYFSDEAKSLIKQLLNVNPKERLGSKGGIREIKEHPFFDNINWKQLSGRKTPTPWKPDVSDMKDLKYFDERLLALDPYSRDSQDSSGSQSDIMKFDGFTLDPSKLRTFALTPNKRSQISQINQQQDQQKVGIRKSQTLNKEDLIIQNNQKTQSLSNRPKDLSPKQFKSAMKSEIPEVNSTLEQQSALHD